MIDNIKQDMWNWITDYVESNHKFYDYKFPPCPYAKAARLKGLVDIAIYDSGGVRDFILEQTDNLINEKKYNVRILVFPAKVNWYFFIKQFINTLNKKLVAMDYYTQYGTALKTKSRYPGLFENGPYFIVIINKLSDVIAGHESLLSTNYYNSWAQSHYDSVVTRRQEFYQKYSNVSKQIYAKAVSKIRTRKKIKQMRDDDPYIYK